jgi:cell division protein FtsB
VVRQQLSIFNFQLSIPQQSDNQIMKKTLLAIWRIVKNKYVAATLIFLLFFIFLGENSLLVINRLSREVSELRKDASIIEKDIQQDSIAAVSLYGNPDAIETYGRENYYMKRENEDIFIIKD